MAYSDKNILVIPAVGDSVNDPRIIFSAAGVSTGPIDISLFVHTDSNGTLSFEGTAGQLFSITNSFSGTFYSVNDSAGIPSLEVVDDGTVKIARYSGNVLFGTNTDNATDKLQVAGSIIGTVLKSSVAQGTAPLTVVSNTLVTNLNADKLDSQEGSYYTNASNLSSGTVSIDRLGSSGTRDSATFLRGDNTWSNVTVSTISDVTTNEPDFLVFTSNTSGNFSLAKISSTKLTFNPSTGLLTSTAFSGNLDASNLNTGTVPVGRLGSSGTRDSTTFLRGDNTWSIITESNIADGTILARVGSNETITAIWTFNSSAIPVFNGGTSGASAPFTVSSNFLVSNLNADFLDGNEGSYYNNASNLNAGTVPVGRLGSSGTANSTSFLAGDNTWKQVAAVTSTTGASALSVILTNAIDASGTLSTAYISTLSYTPSTGTLAATIFSGSGASLTSILESAITDGSILARVGSTETITQIWTFTAIPAFNGGSTVTSAPFTVDSSYLVSGLNADLLDGSEGSYYTNASNLNSGTVPTDRLGTGTANSSTFLRGDRTWSNIIDGALTVNGVLTSGLTTASTVTGIFTMGGDTGFRLCTMNGVSANNPGDVMGTFGLRYLDASPSNVATIDFMRGSGDGAGYMAFNVATTEALRINYQGNLGLQATVNAGTNTGPVMFIGTTGFVRGYPGSFQIGNNGYVDTGWKYKTNGAVSLLHININGDFDFNTAPSGTAGDTISSLTSVATISNTGKLSLLSSGQPQVSAEINSAPTVGWTGTNWTHDGSGGYTHTAGSTAALTKSTLTATASTLYIITFTVSGWSAGGITPSFGGYTLGGVGWNGVLWKGAFTSTTAAIAFTPTSDFVGKISAISIVTVPTLMSSKLSMTDGTGTSLEIKTNTATTNSFFIGTASGDYNLGASNIGIGGRSLGSNLTGASNVAIGYEASYLALDASSNVAIGQAALRNNRRCGQNVAIGYYTMGDATTDCNQNVAVGYQTLRYTTGWNNIAIGAYSQSGISNTAANNIGIGTSSFDVLTTGYDNIAIGNSSGHSITAGVENIFIGRAAGNNASQKVDAWNSVAIGLLSYTTANNQMVYGNTWHTEHKFVAGNIGLQATIPPTDTGPSIFMGLTASLNGVSNTLQLANNLYVTGGAWKYKATGYATLLHHSNIGEFKFYTAPSGTIDSTATITNYITISNTGQLITYRANDTATGGGQIYLNGTTGNRIDFAAVGSAVPAFTTRSAGTKIVLWPSLDADSADLAIGVGPGAIWMSVDASAANFRWYAGTTEVMTLTGTGILSANEFQSSSDERLKTNIQACPGIPLIEAMNPVKFDWIANSKTSYGLIAQELETLLPELVMETSTGYKSISYTPIIAILVAAVQQLNGKVEELQTRISELE
jgi:hypothetical protein